MRRIRGFNPTLVRLRPHPAGPGPGGGESFNPTLVRLRQINDDALRNGSFVFQSHAGSIEARTRKWCCVGDPTVSIPRWFD